MSGDRFIGLQTADGRWVKAVLPDGRYRLCFSKPGDRTVTYEMVDREEMIQLMKSP